MVYSFSSFSRGSHHYDYCLKLMRIGRKLGYDTSGENPIDRTDFRIAKSDCAWYLAMDSELNGIAGIPPKIPIIVFEVLYADQEKAMRTALTSFVLRVAYRGIFVVLKDRRETDEQYQKGIGYYKKVIARLGGNRFGIWREEDVNRLERGPDP